MRAGETYRCTDPECGAEITVMKGPARAQASGPRCACGRDMERTSSETGASISGEMRAT